MELDAEQTGKHPTLVRDVLDRRIDGFIVHGLLTRSEIRRATRRLERTAAQRTPSPIGSYLGMSLGDLAPDATDRTEYMADAEASRAAHRAAFGFDPHQRVATALEPMSDGGRLVPASENGRDYNPGHARWFEPGCGGLRAHVGDEFRALLQSGPMAHLVTTTIVAQEVSYYFVLRRPEGGGTLSIFDLQADTYRHPRTWDGSRVDDEFDDLPSYTVDTPEGSLLVFGGGWRWHRVEPVLGRTPRITYGGFFAPAIEGCDLHCWT